MDYAKDKSKAKVRKAYKFMERDIKGDKKTSARMKKELKK